MAESAREAKEWEDKLAESVREQRRRREEWEWKQQASEREYEERMQQLVSQLREEEKRNCDVFSTSASQISLQEAPSFSMQISEIFSKYPEELIKFVESMQGERAVDPKELGDMVCMLISRDGMSVDKFYDVNRTFLKRKIKEQEKRFRFVLIYKPDRK